MTIRPIDLQVLIPKATEVGKVQQVSNQQSSLQQQQMAEQWHQLAANRQQQVQRTFSGTGGKVEPDDQGQTRGRDAERKKRSRRSQNADDEQDGGYDPLRGHHIDIKT